MVLQSLGFQVLRWLKHFENCSGIHTTKVFQKRQGENDNILMVRPIRPRQSHENEEGCGREEEEEEEVVVVHGLWKVGDLVDWWKDDCYWSGTVLEVREEDETVKVCESFELCCKMCF